MSKVSALVRVDFARPWQGHQKYKVSQSVHYPARNLRVTIYRYYVPVSMVNEAVKAGGKVKEE